MSAVTRKDQRARRRKQIRKRLSGTAARPRLAVMVSNKNIYVQAIDDQAGATLASASNSGKKGGPSTVAAATELGAQVAADLKKKGVEAVTFDRGGYRYHGRVKAIAEAVREAGISC